MIKEKRLKYIVFCLLNMTGIFAFVGQVAAQAIVGDTHSGYSVATSGLPVMMIGLKDMNYYGRRGRESGKLLKKVLPALKAIISLNNLYGGMKWIITRK